jgi:hypothetical protein
MRTALNRHSLCWRHGDAQAFTAKFKGAGPVAEQPNRARTPPGVGGEG